jgi:hypothetical protein
LCKQCIHSFQIRTQNVRLFQYFTYVFDSLRITGFTTEQISQLMFI